MLVATQGWESCSKSVAEAEVFIISLLFNQSSHIPTVDILFIVGEAP